LNLKLQEEKYRNIIANMNLGLLEVDIEDNIQHANQSFCKMSGYTLEELIGKKAAELFIDEEEKIIIEEKNVSRKEGVSDMYSIQVKNKNGEKRWWVVSGAPRYNDSGQLVGSVGIHLDLTEQKHLEEELKIAKLKAEESSKAKESFLATMSHELRTPLNAIVGITELMQMDAKTSNKENLDILSFSSKTLLALISDILDLSKIDAGKIELTSNPFNLKQLLNGINQMFRAACEEKNVELILNIDNTVPEFIIGDELRLSQILNNLISNAVKFTSKGFVKINVTADVISSDIRKLNFKVSDSGIGIKKESLKTIFEDFEQADKKIATRFGGTGLGLSITKKLIQLIGGEIKVESKLNKGSTFSFNLVFEIAKSEQKGNEIDNTGQQLVTLKLEDKTILIVEDNIVNQKVAVSYLNHWGLKYDIANNGKEALHMMVKKHYDLALIDLFMPVMDGFETIKRIRKNKAFKGFPIIALTASAELNLMDKAIELGADRCITKPFNSQQLHDTIVSLIRVEHYEVSVNKKSNPAKKPSLEFKFIDLKNLNDASLGSQKFVGDMLNILSSEIPASIKAAENLLQAGNWINFSKEIHKLKNSMLMLGIESLRNDLRFMEEYSKKNQKTDEVAATFKRLKATWKKALPEIADAKKRVS
jgi:PAS domain S-box-containing protein